MKRTRPERNENQISLRARRDENYASSKSGANAVVARITEKSGKAIAVQGDVSQPKDIQRLFSEKGLKFLDRIEIYEIYGGLLKVAIQYAAFRVRC